MTETFTTWLLDQTGRDDPIGDLAKDAKVDPAFPDGSPDDCRAYLARRGSSAANEALESAIEEYQY